MRPFIFALLLFAVVNASAEASVNVTDFRGRKITLTKPATRIVCLIESALSGLYMLGAGNSVVGVPANVYQPPVFSWYAALDERIRRKKLSAPGNWDFVNIESVIALKPDLVIIWSQQAESIAALEERGIPVFGVFLSGRGDVYREMAALGALTGTEKRAAELVAYTRKEVARFARRTEAIPPLRRPSVYYMWAQGNLETSCGGSTVNELIQLAGARNVCGAVRSEHLVVNLEKVLAWNPDLIVMWYNERKGPRDIMADPQWRPVKAVANRRVYEFPEMFLCDLWTLKFQHAVKMVAAWSHPDLFRNIDLEREQRVMLEKLYGRTFGKANSR